MNFQRSSGILLHPTSLPGKFGIGDFGPEAYHFIDFLKQSGQSLWQVLPLGPTSVGDSPYQSFSAFAGNPLLISPAILCEKGYLTPSELEDTPSFPEERTDFSKVIPYKTQLLEKASNTFFETATKETKDEFAQFCEKNNFWLQDYALFISLKDYFIKQRKYAGLSPEFEAFAEKTSSFLPQNVQKDYYFGGVWSTWPEELIQRRPDAIHAWTTKLSHSIDYYKFQQFEFFEEWSALKSYTKEKDIKIIGDIPIFVAYDSADVWANPLLFHMDEKGFPTFVAGVPPDYFSTTGQLWGNPLYDWEQHKKTDYRWWIARISSTLSMVDILRIDHFRGFESYWAIPFGKENATVGAWQKGPGAELFFAIQKALGNLPIIAEDLGIITEEVIALREILGFPGMKVLQFAFSGSPDNDYLPHTYEKHAVVYTGTHDNDTTLGWYHGAKPKEQDFFRRYMNVSGETPPWDFIRLAMASTAVFSIFPLQDVLALDSHSRMNTPSTTSGNWQFRFKAEQLEDNLSNRLAYLSKIFGRLPKPTELP